MKTKGEIRVKIKQLRTQRDAAKPLPSTQGYLSLSNAAIRALEWVLGYKRKPLFWCYQCALLHNNLKCPRCGNATEHKISKESDNG